ncbi:hypothetical protein ACXJJ3_39400 [Kribbella sp. WER1]
MDGVAGEGVVAGVVEGVGVAVVGEGVLVGVVVGAVGLGVVGWGLDGEVGWVVGRVVGFVVGFGVVVDGVVVDGVVLDGVVVGAEVVGPTGFEVGRVVADGWPVGAGVGWAGPGSVVDHGGARSVRVADGVGAGLSGRPTGSDGRLVDLDVPSVRSTVGVDCADGDCGGSFGPSGPKYRKPASRATPAAPAPNFSTGGRRRTCRGLDCLTNKPFTPGRPAAYRDRGLNRSSR